MSDNVSCVCLTMPSRERTFLPLAVESYQRQTHANRDLVIVCEPDSDVDYIATLAPGSVIVRPDAKLTVGAKRNIGNVYASGDYIAVWDDDDYSAPMRLHWQLENLKAHRVEVTALKRVFLTNPERSKWWETIPCSIGIDSSLF